MGTVGIPEVSLSMRLPCMNSSSTSTPQTSLTSVASSTTGAVVTNSLDVGCAGAASHHHHHLSLYPHIHNTPPGSDIVVSSQDREDCTPKVPPAKPPIFSNPYLGSDLLSEQLVREWDLDYGDTQAVSNHLTSSSDSLDNACNNSLVNGLENLHVSSTQPSNSHTMIDPSITCLPDSHVATCSHTTSPLGSMVDTSHSNNSSTSSLSSGSLPSSVASDERLSFPSNVANSKCGVISTTVSSSASTCHSTNNNISSKPPVAVPTVGQCERLCCSEEHSNQPTLTTTHTRRYSTTTSSSSGAAMQDGMNEETCHNSNKRLVERSTSRESPGESELSETDEWSSGDESDMSTTASSHQDPNCDCCACHMMHQKQGGGRQKYSDRRDRLLQILNKKKARSSINSSSTTTLTSSTGSQDNAIATQNIDKILDYIERDRVDKVKNTKKAAKKARQKQRKISSTRCCTNKDYDGDDEGYKEVDDNEEYQEVEEHDNGYEEEDDDDDEFQFVESGPLAELRRKAPDITVTVVKPGQGHHPGANEHPPRRIVTAAKSSSYASRQHHQASQPNNVPVAGKYVSSLSQVPSEPQQASRPLLHATRPSTQTRQPSIPVVRTQHPLASGSIGAPSPLPNQDPALDTTQANGTNGLSDLLKGLENMKGDKNKGSQMVTIRRVMDPSSAEPTVTITLKGEQPETDKMLFKLVNGQDVSGKQNNGGKSKVKRNASKQSTSVATNYPPLEIPEGLSPDEIKKFKKKKKKDRQRQKKQPEKRDALEETRDALEETKLKYLQLQKQQELLMLQQQVELIEKQKIALQCQQEALMRQQQKLTVANNSNDTSATNNNSNGNNTNKKGKKGKGKTDNDTKVNANKKVSAVVYDEDDMAKSFNLPSGVSINKVAGQPGMVNISNNFTSGFTQPLLSNPNIYSGSVSNPVSMAKNASNFTPLYNGDAASIGKGLQWTGTSEKCSSYPSQDNVIVVDTNNSNSKPNGSNHSSRLSSNSSSINKKEMSSDEKVQAAVDGMIDPGALNKTQKKKFKKMKKAIQEEKEKAILKQKEEDDLMDQMYMLSRVDKSKSVCDDTKSSKNNSKKSQSKQKENRSVPQTAISNPSSNVNSSKQVQGKNLKNQNKQDFQQNKGKQNIKSNTVGKVSSSSNVNPKFQDKKTTNQPIKSQKCKTNTSAQDPKSSQKPMGNNSIPQIKVQPTSNLKIVNQNNKQKSAQSRQQCSTAESHMKFNNLKSNQQNTLNANIPDRQNVGKSISFASEDVGEARYAQYLAANKNTLVTITNAKSGNASNNRVGYPNVDNSKLNSNGIKKVKNKKRGKNGAMEDLNTIDSVFAPKDVADGELDETERDVEAFKRFCFNNVARNSGEKPKVNFNIKDIMIKKKPCNGNL